MAKIHARTPPNVGRNTGGDSTGILGRTPGGTQAGTQAGTPMPGHGRHKPGHRPGRQLDHGRDTRASGNTHREIRGCWSKKICVQREPRPPRQSAQLRTYVTHDTNAEHDFRCSRLPETALKYPNMSALGTTPMDATVRDRRAPPRGTCYEHTLVKTPGMRWGTTYLMRHATTSSLLVPQIRTDAMSCVPAPIPIHYINCSINVRIKLSILLPMWPKCGRNRVKFAQIASGHC